MKNKTFIIISLLLCLLLVSCNKATRSLKYEISKNGEYYIVTGISRNDIARIEIPNEYKKLPVKEIKQEAFMGLQNLSEVIIGENVSVIGDFVFKNCTELKKVKLPSKMEKLGKGVFLGCSSLEQVNIPLGIDELDYQLFKDCISLENITIPENIKYINASVFDGCKMLNNVSVTKGILEIGSLAFNGCESLKQIRIPLTVDYIEYDAFLNCTSLENFIVSENNDYYESIDGNLYLKDESFLIQFAIGNKNTGIELPEDVIINSTAFQGVNNSIFNVYDNGYYLSCNGNPYGILVKAINEDITSCQIHESTVNIISNAFKDCKNIKSVMIPNAVQTIGSSIFTGCTSLESITLPFLNEAIGYLFGGDYYLYNSDYVVNSLKEVIINGGNEIADHAFYGCENITKIVISDEITSVGEGAFEGCNSLVSLTIPFVGGGTDDYRESSLAYTFGGLSKISPSLEEVIVTGDKLHYSAFEGCSGTFKVIVSNNLKEVGLNAFYNCDNLNYNIYNNARYIGSIENPYMLLVSSIDTNITECIIHEDTKEICSEAFLDCKLLETITFSKNAKLEKIGSAAFSFCYQLESITIPSSVKIIEGYTFFGSLSEVIFEENSNLAYIGDRAFYECKELESIELPNSLKYIGTEAFNTNTYQFNIYENGAYVGNKENPYMFLVTCVDDNITECTIHEETIGICGEAFLNCQNLESIIIPSNISTIGKDAFKYCNYLTIYCKMSKDQVEDEKTWNPSWCTIVWDYNE